MSTSNVSQSSSTANNILESIQNVNFRISTRYMYGLVLFNKHGF